MMRLLSSGTWCAAVFLLASSSLAQMPPPPAAEPLPGTAIIEGGAAPVPLQTLPSNRHPLAVPAGTVQPNSTQPGINLCDPRCTTLPLVYEVQLDTIFWKLDRGLSLPLVLNSATTAELLTTGDLDHGFQPGPRMNFDYITEEGAIFQVGYFGIYSWNSSAGVNLPNTLQLPPTLGTDVASFDDFDTALLGLESRINSGEVNLLLGEPESTLKTIVGMRFIKFDERFTMNTIDDVDGNGWYDIDVRNDLLGAHVGARWRGRWRRLDLESFTKIGVFGNDARQSTFVTSNDYRVVERNFSPTRGATSFMVDYSFVAKYCWSQNTYLRAGYNIVWLDTIARATDQFDPTNNAVSGSALRMDGRAFIHGATLGIETRW